MPRATGLTDTERRFVDEYLTDLNGTQAYRRTYPRTPYASARVLATRLLAKVSIRAEIDAAIKARSQRTRITADKVLREYARLAFSDIGDVVDLSDPDSPRLKPRTDIPADARRTIQEVSRTQHGVKVKLADKRGALDKLAEHLGIAQPIPPLESLLAGLKPELAAAVRAELAASLSGGNDPPGGPGRREA